MQQNTQRSYRIDSRGTVFTSDTVVIVDDDGNIVAMGAPHVTPYPAAVLRTVDDVVVAQKNDVSQSGDPLLISFANYTWSDAVVSAAISALEAPKL